MPSVIDVDGEIARVRLTRGLDCIIDAVDAPLVAPVRWCLIGIGVGCPYAQGVVDGGHALMHRLIMGFPLSFLDHVNGNGLDNRRANLRLATSSQNNMNKRKSPRQMGSQFKGVRFRPDRAPKSPWVAVIQKDRVERYLGSHVTEIEAALAYDHAAKQMFGEFARLNFPDGHVTALHVPEHGAALVTDPTEAVPETTRDAHD